MDMKKLLEQPFEPHGIRPSEIGRCPRYIVFAATNEPPDEGASIPAVAILGTAWCEQLQKRLAEEGYECEYPIVWKGLEGRIDAYHPQRKEVIEIKLVSSKAEPFLPQHEHILQLAIYMDSVDAELGRLIYFFREFPDEYREFTYTPKEIAPYVDEATHRLAELTMAIQLRFIPDIPKGYAPYKYPCSWYSSRTLVSRCPYFSKCWQLTSEEEEACEELVEQALAADELVALYTAYKEAQQAYNQAAKAYKQALERVTKQLDKSVTYSLGSGLQLVYVRKKVLDNETLAKVLPNLPYKEIGYWQIKSLRGDRDGHEDDGEIGSLDR